MSFTCTSCRKPQPERTKPVRVVLETRTINYPARKYRRGGKIVEDPGGKGTEIVHEALMCEPCVPTVE